VVSHPLAEALTLARRVAANDLSGQVSVRSSDETGQLMQALNDMTASLGSMVGGTAARHHQHGVRRNRQRPTCLPAPNRRPPAWKRRPRRWS
jgi:nitrogen fixation/metabolism regulation signal transduction histidine kinase